MITKSGRPPHADFFDYSARFLYRWKQFFLHTSLKSLTPGISVKLPLTADFAVRVPEQGSGVAGVLIADPCVNSPTGLVFYPCTYGEKFNTIQRIPALLNAFVGDTDTSFWGIAGDNLYDGTGEITADFFSRISLKAKSKLFVTVPGNHDYWISGSPRKSIASDQCAVGHMQYYLQDTMASRELKSAAPLDLSVDPDAKRHEGLGCMLPAISNTFWYQQVGNLGLIGQSGAYSLNDTMPFMLEACTWASRQPGLDVLMLLGHWDRPNAGASVGMSMPEWYREMAALPGCADFHRRGMLKFVMGHTHCNNPDGQSAGAGFRLASFGMHGCGDFGVPVIDTTAGRIRLWYFDTSSDKLYTALMYCLHRKGGWRACTDLADLWLDQKIANNELQR